jgi:peroxiredoxin
MSRSRRTGLILALTLLVSVGCSTSPQPTPATTPAFIEPPAISTDQAPDFALSTPDGQLLHLTDYRGQIILINFWASWCRSCDAEMVALETYFQDHKDAGFTIIAVNYRESAKIAAAYAQEEGLTFPIVLDDKGKVADLYGVTGIPTSFFIDRDGSLLGYWPGAVLNYMLEQSLTPLLLEE